MVTRKIKIYIACHKECELVQSTIFTPIQVGASLSSKKLSMLRDDFGENISQKNLMYSELTAIYWAWKNCDADYVGFMHYRRHLNFDENNPICSQEYQDWCLVSDNITSEYLIKNKIYDAAISSLVEKYDVILPKKWKVDQHVNIYNQYRDTNFLNVYDYEMALNVLNNKYPEYSATASSYNDSIYPYWANIFIVRRDIFEQYAQWIFDILFETEKQLDFSLYSREELRVMGHLAERLTDIYFYHLQKQETRLRFCELARTFVQNVDKAINFQPYFSERNIAVAFAFNVNFVPVFSVVLKSLLQKIESKFNYDLIVLNLGIPVYLQNVLKGMISSENVSLRFVDVGQKLANIKFITNDSYTQETFYRFVLASDMFADYDKILYLDSDILIRCDVSEIYNIDLKNTYGAAIRDYVMPWFNLVDYVPQKYLTEYLGMKHPDRYFCAGVILLNLKKMRTEKMYDVLVSKGTLNKYKIVDQDILNSIFDGNIIFLNSKYNVMHGDGFWDKGILDTSVENYEDYISAVCNPSIIHYAGPLKPWKTTRANFFSNFWDVARSVPFYASLVAQLND